MRIEVDFFNLKFLPLKFRDVSIFFQHTIRRFRLSLCTSLKVVVSMTGGLDLLKIHTFFSVASTIRNFAK